MAQWAALAWEQRWRTMRSSAAEPACCRRACLRSRGPHHGRCCQCSSSFQRRTPSHPQGFWLAAQQRKQRVDLLPAPRNSTFSSSRYGRRPERFCADTTGAPSSGSSAEAFPLALEKAERSTSFAKKFFPSMGTIMICNLSERRSAIIF